MSTWPQIIRLRFRVKVPTKSTRAGRKLGGPVSTRHWGLRRGRSKGTSHQDEAHGGLEASADAQDVRPVLGLLPLQSRCVASSRTPSTRGLLFPPTWDPRVNPRALPASWWPAHWVSFVLLLRLPAAPPGQTALFTTPGAPAQPGTAVGRIKSGRGDARPL